MLSMNRTLRESVIGAGRNHSHSHRRGHSINGVPNSKDSADDNLDLFSKSRRSLSVAPSDDSDVSVKLGRLSLGSAKPGRSGLDDLLSAADGGKHDYDWLLTPPGTPLVPTFDGNESQAGLMAPRSGPLVRSISTAKTSRLSVSHSENNHVAKPTRSSSVTRPSVSNSQYSTYSNKSTNILNTSSASVSSYIRPSTPTNRSSSISRPSTPSSRPSVSRSSTPSRPRPTHSAPSIEIQRATQNSRPSTPTRPQISASFNTPAPRTTSRPSTPTRRNSAPSYSPSSGPSTPGGRSSLTNGKPTTSVSRPSSPGPRVRAPSQPIVIHDFRHDIPPNLRTSLPDRPLTAGRSRPGVALTAKANAESTTNSASVGRRQSSPVVSRGRLQEPTTGRSRAHSNGPPSHDVVNSRRELSSRKPAKTSSTDSTGFGRTISKKSLDMAIRHMDIRNGGNGFRGSNLFPQSIRSSSQKVHPGTPSVNGSLSLTENGSRFSESGSEEDRSQSCAKLSNVDIYESSRYDMILLKEDLKNTNWLHSIDDKSDQGSIFDNGFELLPEPFDPL